MEPSDEELLQAARDADLLMPDGSTGYLESADLSELVLAFARAVLAHWGNYPAQPDSSPAPPAEGEVAELARWLRMQGEAQKPGPNSLLSDRTKKEHHAAGVRLTRAADLLEQRHPAPPTEGEVGELIEGLNLISDGMDAMGHESDSWLVARTADLLEQRHPAPVPVSERRPGPEDCDGEGRCWWLLLEHECNAMWCHSPTLTHWLPATALPLPAGTDEELLGLMPQQLRVALARYNHQPAPPAEGEGLPSDQEIADVFSQGCRDFSCSYKPLFLGGARAILARWGRPAPAPAPATEGEVGELAKWLKSLEGASIWFEPGSPEDRNRNRTADLLEQRHPAPVPVSERLPEPEDCDAEERCWLLAPRWILPPSELTHWLPATALPLPAGEVQP